LPKTKVGKRFAAQDILQKDDEMNGQQSPTETYSTWVLTIPILYQSCLLMCPVQQVPCEFFYEDGVRW